MVNGVNSKSTAFVKNPSPPVSKKVKAELSIFERFLSIFGTEAEESPKTKPLTPVTSILNRESLNSTPRPPLRQRVSIIEPLPLASERGFSDQSPTPRPPSESGKKIYSPLSKRASMRASLPSAPEMDSPDQSPTPRPPSISEGRTSFKRGGTPIDNKETSFERLEFPPTQSIEMFDEMGRESPSSSPFIEMFEVMETESSSPSSSVEMLEETGRESSFVEMLDETGREFPLPPSPPLKLSKAIWKKNKDLDSYRLENQRSRLDRLEIQRARMERQESQRLHVARQERERARIERQERLRARMGRQESQRSPVDRLERERPRSVTFLADSE